MLNEQERQFQNDRPYPGTTAPAIDQLTERYGSKLERLDRLSKLELLGSLAVRLYAEAADKQQSSGEVSLQAYRLIEGESPDTLLSLCETLIAQLRSKQGEPA